MPFTIRGRWCRKLMFQVVIGHWPVRQPSEPRWQVTRSASPDLFPEHFRSRSVQTGV
jgi:hypothetical protein